MKLVSRAQPLASPILAWFTVVMIGVAAPALTMLWLANASASTAMVAVSGPIMAVGLMGTGMIAAAAAGSLRTGVLLALLTGAGLMMLAWLTGMAPPPHPLSTAVAIVIACTSFAARGALFARSASDKGWWIAVFVVTGEVAILATALALPDALPGWLLALLPAQWASMAIQTLLIGDSIFAASSALLALAGTAAATLLVVGLWPRRWPYLVMFTAWLGFSALVWHYPSPATPWVHAPLATASDGKAMPTVVER
jgi:hypothetical protein